MLLRKALSAYIASFAIVLFYSFYFSSDNLSGGLTRFGEIMQWMSLITLFAFPVVLIYGSLVSIVTEMVTGRLLHNEAWRVIVSCVCHLALGALFGLLFGIPLFILTCAAAALIYFLMDRLIGHLLARGWRKGTTIAVTLASPLLVIAAIGGVTALGS
ncbi:hypothetical protein D3P08_16955 [Paenibacillus nanensis]|uniref:Uncharacterized protein n=1 Tax=Paenibacillus nanensis TaxID=393251 RepID=A0A3A1V0V3_9BACL|nr:hypothetical protein [Paenibacillus nanensis]RIX51170.1 hypothetical protein D3P08_16955 [Paenibacillus nanensis]